MMVAVMINIPFNEWSSERHRRGDKTATTRTKRYGRPGDQFTDAGRTYELTHVVLLPLRAVHEFFWEVEGCERPSEFKEVWEEIHPRKGYVPDWMVHLHLYREVSDA